MKTRQGKSLFLKVDVGGATVRVFGRPEELTERLEASGYDTLEGTETASLVPREAKRTDLPLLTEGSGASLGYRGHK